MKWLDRLELRLGRYAIPGLTRIIAVFSVIAWIISKFNPAYLNILVLNRADVLAGAVWQLVSFTIVPQVSDSFLFIPIEHSSAVWMVFYAWMLWSFGDALEEEWGSFRLNAYIGLGMLGTIANTFLFGVPGTFSSINLSILFAVATLAPELPIQPLLFFTVPIKWVALVFAILFAGVPFLFGSILVKLLIVLSFTNYLFFFAPMWVRRWRGRREVQGRRVADGPTARGATAEARTIHQCKTCGRTDGTNPELEFRVSGNDGEDYCQDHLPKTR